MNSSPELLSTTMTHKPERKDLSMTMLGKVCKTNRKGTSHGLVIAPQLLFTTVKRCIRNPADSN
jgi:hypothetical protein